MDNVTFKRNKSVVFLAGNIRQPLFSVRGSFDKEVTKRHHSVSFPNIKKIWNIHFVGNLILSISCESYYNDVTVTSFMNISYGDIAVEVVP